MASATPSCADLSHDLPHGLAKRHSNEIAQQSIQALRHELVHWIPHDLGAQLGTHLDTFDSGRRNDSYVAAKDTKIFGPSPRERWRFADGRPPFKGPRQTELSADDTGYRAIHGAGCNP